MLKRCALVCSLCVSAFLMSTFSARATATGVVSDPTTLPLLQFIDLAYSGGFRLPAESAAGDNFSYGGTPLTFNPAANSLFVGTLSGKVAEVTIPSPVDSGNVTDLPFAAYVQPFADPTEGRLAQVGSGADLGGLLVFGGRLFGTGYIYYDASNSQTVSHYSRSLTLSQPSVQGMYSVWQNQRAGLVSGYMATVPPEWQAKLGGPAITGQCCIPIVTRTSFGPAAFAWDPASLGSASPLPATPLVYYTEDHATLGPWTGSDANYGATTKMGGMAIIAGTRTALFVGRNGTGPYCYGVGVTDLMLAGTTSASGTHYCYDPVNANQAPHAYPYNYQLWAYDLNDFAAVKAGQKQPWEVVPYGVWPLTLPTTAPDPLVGGVGYDAARQVLYFSQLQADPDGYAYRAVVHALKITVPAVQTTGTIGGRTTTTGTTTTAGTTTTTSVQMIAPAPGSTLTGSSVQFQWTGATDASLAVGTTAGRADVYSADQNGNSSATVTGLPTNGSTVYVRLWAQVNGAWQRNDYTYTAATGTTNTGTTTTLAQMTTPAPGSIFTASTVQFQWTGGTGVSKYWLSMGAAAGGEEIYSQDEGTSLSATVTGLPANGSPVYVRLWSMINGAWKHNDYTYTATTPGGATTAPAQMTTPAAGSTLAGSTVQFQWTAGAGVSKYWLSMGAAAGGEEIFSQDEGTNLNATVTVPTNGAPLYVRIWSMINGAWKRNDYVYTAALPGGATAGAPAQLLTPTPRSQWNASTVQFQWTSGTGVTDYWLSMGANPGGEEIYSADYGTNQTATVTGLPTNSSTVYVRLWSMIGGKWYRNDYTYTTK